MAAGLGFKDFTTGEVLTAADVDGYLMQGVWVFASAAARDAAVTSPQEGNFAYLKDTNTTTYYTGSAWTNLDTTGMVNPMTTTGDTIYSSSGSTPARLGIGSTGQVLTVSGGVPSWATPTSGGAYTLLSTTTLSGSETSVTSISGSYQDLFIEVYGVTFSTSNATPYLYLNSQSSNSFYQGAELGTTYENVGGFTLNDNADQWLRTDSNNYVSCLVNSYANTNSYKSIWCSVGYQKTGPANAQVGINKTFYSNSAVTSVQFGLGGGRTFSTGTIKIWGIK